MQIAAAWVSYIAHFVVKIVHELNICTIKENSFDTPTYRVGLLSLRESSTFNDQNAWLPQLPQDDW